MDKSEEDFIAAIRLDQRLEDVTSTQRIRRWLRRSLRGKAVGL